MPKNQMRPILGADIVEHAEQETQEQDNNSRINGEAEYRQDLVDGAEPRRLKMKTEILIDQMPLEAKNAALEVTENCRRCTTIGDQQAKAGHRFKDYASVDQYAKQEQDQSLTEIAEHRAEQ